MRVIEWIITNESPEGPVNIASPHPLPNADFMRALREAWGVPIGLPATGSMINLAGFFCARVETRSRNPARRSPEAAQQQF